jgi:succinate dehydrogenase subunit D
MRARTPLRAAGYRRDALWLAFLLHRLSGVALACFLPLHFLMLALALGGEARLDAALRWTANPLVRVAETGLVFLLTVHPLGGLRVLAIEHLSWSEAQKRKAGVALLIAGLAAIAFVVRWA